MQDYGPLGVFLEYFVREILVPVSYEDDTANDPTKDEDMINHAPIITSEATGTQMEKINYVPFHKDFVIYMNFLWDILYNIFGGTTVRVHDKPFDKIKNGKYAFFLLKNSLLGPKYVTHMDALLDINLRSFSYDG